MEEILINLINKQKEKEDIIKLQSNNVGIIGEEFIKKIFVIYQI